MKGSMSTMLLIAAILVGMMLCLACAGCSFHGQMSCGAGDGNPYAASMSEGRGVGIDYGPMPKASASSNHQTRTNYSARD